MNFMTSGNIPPVSLEFVNHLRTVFRGPQVRPGADRDKMMYDQGQADVIEWIAQHAGAKVLSGNPEDLEKPEAPQPWWRRMFAKLPRLRR